MSADHKWYYFSDDFLGNSNMIGPIDEPQFARLVKDGKLGVTTQVNSPTRTNGNWLELRQVSSLLKLLQDGENERKEAKAAAAEEQPAVGNGSCRGRECQRPNYRPNADGRDCCPDNDQQP